MPVYYYSRDIVPVGNAITLEVQFKDSSGQYKDTNPHPTVTIYDASSTLALTTTSNGVSRIGVGRYKYSYTIPENFVEGIWNDTWDGYVDGYSISNTFDFLVRSEGTIEAVGSSTVEPEVNVGDEPIFTFSNDEKKNLNILIKILKLKLQSTAYTPQGNICNVFSDNDLVAFLCASLSEFNATPTITNYGFGNTLVSTVFSDILTQGAYLIALAAVATIEAGREFTLNDNSVTINPPPVSSTMTGLYSGQLSDYRGKLKEIKRNHRPIGRGMGAGSIIASPNIRMRGLRHRRENILY